MDSKKDNKKKKRTYSSWQAMKNRCYYPSNKDYKNYGGRGIKVCDRWKNSFENFLNDLGYRPINYTLERIDVNKNYTKTNCKWIPKEQQGANKRNNRLITAFGKTLHLSEWSRIYNKCHESISCRIRAGWTPEDALASPPTKEKHVLLYEGQVYNLAELASKLKISGTTIQKWVIKKGLSIEELLQKIKNKEIILHPQRKIKYKNKIYSLVELSRELKLSLHIIKKYIGKQKLSVDELLNKIKSGEIRPRNLKNSGVK